VAPALALIRGEHLQTLAVVPALVVLQGEPVKVLNYALDVDIVIALPPLTREPIVHVLCLQTILHLQGFAVPALVICEEHAVDIAVALARRDTWEAAKIV
jgi:hypothetical protein